MGSMDKKLLQQLEVEDLVKGYVKDEVAEAFLCVFCGKEFEEGYLYPDGERFMTAETAVIHHVEEEHGGSFQGLLDLDKGFSGISESQRLIMRGLRDGVKSQELSQAMGITPSTVRAHKFNLHKMEGQAKIFLAAMKLVETAREEGNSYRKLKQYGQKQKVRKKPVRQVGAKADEIKLKEERSRLFSLNSLYPFFNQSRIK